MLNGSIIYYVQLLLHMLGTAHFSNKNRRRIDSSDILAATRLSTSSSSSSSSSSFVWE